MGSGIVRKEKAAYLVGSASQSIAEGGTLNVVPGLKKLLDLGKLCLHGIVLAVRNHFDSRRRFRPDVGESQEVQNVVEWSRTGRMRSFEKRASTERTQAGRQERARHQTVTAVKANTSRGAAQCRDGCSALLLVRYPVIGAREGGGPGAKRVQEPGSSEPSRQRHTFQRAVNALKDSTIVLPPTFQPPRPQKDVPAKITK